jgi:hypothetical protein
MSHTASSTSPTVAASPLARRVDNPMCPQCCRPMWIVRVDRLGLGFDLRTLECRQCKRETTVVVKHS